MCFHGNDAMAKKNEKYTDNETQWAQATQK